VSATGHSSQPSSSSIPPALRASYPVRAGNRVTALVDGEAAFRRIGEAVDAARNSVWLTVAYIDPDFRMPDGRGSLFDVLDRAKARGVDVRAIFWRSHFDLRDVFNGRPHEREHLRSRDSKFLLRWDRAQKHYCQHQKSWLIDAGEPGETAFVGGINLTGSSVSPEGHAGRDGGHIHDIYCEIAGPAATDVHHNFVQRWNETSEREHEEGLWPDAASHDRLAFPRRLSPWTGPSIVQIQRTVRAGHYSDTTPTPRGHSFDIAKGEHSVIEQYANAIDGARTAIYIENQYIASPDIVERLHKALARGVDVVFLAPADPEDQVRAARTRPEAKPYFDRIGALGAHPNFTLAGLSARGSDGREHSVYVHDKIMLVDDAWATIGSCNIATQSFFCDTELNASIWDADFVRALRVQLFREHLAADPSAQDIRTAQALFRETAKANADARAHGRALKGLAFALDPAAYAL
jgi:phosphatidylserine/phosphatidylglycerophosphate/cardiolipin synthase-like enzyme